MKHRVSFRSSERGAAVIEFALVSILALTLVFAVIDAGRILWIWNMAPFATGAGARLAATCSPELIPADEADNGPNLQAIKRRVVQTSLGTFPSAQVSVSWQDLPGSACTDENCKFVQVSLHDLQFRSVVPFVPFTVRLPSFTATARRESMSATCS